MSEQNETTAKVKKGGAAKKVVLAILAIVVIAAIVVGILILTGKLDINMSKQSKVEAGVEKLEEKLTRPFTAILDNAEKNNVEVKVLKNVKTDEALDVSTEVSANIEEINVEGLSTSEESMLNTIIELINATKIGANLKYDGDGAAYTKLNAKVDDLEVSGEALYDGDAYLRSEEINKTWLKISKKDLEELFEDADLGVDLDELKETLSTSLEQSSKLMESLNVDEATIEKIEERYSKVYKDFIKEKAKNIEEEKTKVEVNGKEKSCKKCTLELDEDDIKDLIKEYLKTFKKDEDLKKILEKYIDAYSETYDKIKDEVDPYGYSEPEDLSEMLDEMYDGIDEAIKSIDDIEIDVKISLVVYATNTDIYRTDIIAEAEEMKITLETTFNDDSTVMKISAKSNGVSINIGTLTIKERDDGVNVKVELDKSFTKFMDLDTCCVEIDYSASNSKETLSFSVDVGDLGKGKVSIESNVSKNEDKAFAEKSVISFDVDVPDYVKAKGKINIDSSINVGNVSMPTISSSESADVKDEKEMEKYEKDSKENIEKLVEDIQELSIYSKLEPIIEDLF